MSQRKRTRGGVIYQTRYRAGQPVHTYSFQNKANWCIIVRLLFKAITITQASLTVHCQLATLGDQLYIKPCVVTSRHQREAN